MQRREFITLIDGAAAKALGLTIHSADAARPR
jgi:hypothetical protein